MTRLNLDPFWPREVRAYSSFRGPPQPRCQPLAGTREPPSDRGADTDGVNRRRVMPGRSAHGAGRLGSSPAVPRARSGRGLFPCDLRLSARYGVVNWRTLLFTPSLLPLLSIEVTV